MNNEIRVVVALCSLVLEGVLIQWITVRMWKDIRARKRRLSRYGFGSCIFLLVQGFLFEIEGPIGMCCLIAGNASENFFTILRDTCAFGFLFLLFLQFEEWRAARIGRHSWEA